MKRCQYHVMYRNGYCAVDEFLDGQVTRTMASGLTRKAAEAMVNAINNALYYLCRDNDIGGI